MGVLLAVLEAVDLRCCDRKDRTPKYMDLAELPRRVVAGNCGGNSRPRRLASEAGDQPSALVWNRDTRILKRVRGPVAQPDRATVS